MGQAGLQVVVKDLNDFSGTMQSLVQRINSDFQHSTPAQWKSSVLDTQNTDSQVQFGQLMSEFGSAVALVGDYLQQAGSVFFESDLPKLVTAVTALGEAAAQIAKNYSGAAGVDSQGAQAVDDALNNAQATQVSPNLASGG